MIRRATTIASLPLDWQSHLSLSSGLVDTRFALKLCLRWDESMVAPNLLWFHSGLSNSMLTDGFVSVLVRHVRSNLLPGNSAAKITLVCCSLDASLCRDAPQAQIQQLNEQSLC